MTLLSSLVLDQKGHPANSSQISSFLVVEKLKQLVELWILHAYDVNHGKGGLLGGKPWRCWQIAVHPPVRESKILPIADLVQKQFKGCIRHWKLFDTDKPLCDTSLLLLAMLSVLLFERTWFHVTNKSQILMMRPKHCVLSTIGLDVDRLPIQWTNQSPHPYGLASSPNFYWRKPFFTLSSSRQFPELPPQFILCDTFLSWTMGTRWACLVIKSKSQVPSLWPWLLFMVSCSGIWIECFLPLDKRLGRNGALLVKEASLNQFWNLMNQSLS